MQETEYLEWCNSHCEFHVEMQHRITVQSLFRQLFIHSEVGQTSYTDDEYNCKKRDVQPSCRINARTYTTSRLYTHWTNSHVIHLYLGLWMWICLQRHDWYYMSKTLSLGTFWFKWWSLDHRSYLLCHLSFVDESCHCCGFVLCFVCGEVQTQSIRHDWHTDGGLYKFSKWCLRSFSTFLQYVKVLWFSQIFNNIL